MTNYSSGHEAEVDAAEYLESHGFSIIELNWKTRYCEIDIVAEKNKVVHFIEVKSRKTGLQGDALEYITGKKLNHMAFAAEVWTSEHSWQGDYQLGAIGIDAGRITYIDHF